MLLKRHHPVLVRIELAHRPLVQRPADETTEIAGAEPGLVFEENGLEWAVVAVEEGGYVGGCYRLKLMSLCFESVVEHAEPLQRTWNGAKTNVERA